MSSSILGRIFLGILFLGMGVLKWLDFNGTVDYFSYLGFPIPAVFVVLAIMTLTLCGLGLIFNFGTYFAASVLISYLIIALAMAHNIFVTFDKTTLTVFLQVLGLIGGLLYVAKAASVDDNDEYDSKSSKKSHHVSKVHKDETNDDSDDVATDSEVLDEIEKKESVKEEKAEKSQLAAKSQKVVVKTKKPAVKTSAKVVKPIKSTKTKSNGKDLPAEI
jgi:putative oxidoreductase